MKRRDKFWSLLLLHALYQALTLSLPTPATARTLRVPANYTSIQSAVNAAADGDEIIVAPGIYTEAVFISKHVNLHSEKPTDPQIVKTTRLNRIVLFNTQVTLDQRCRIAGFTIISKEADGIDADEHAPLVEYNVISAPNSSAHSPTSGINKCRGVVRHNTIENCLDSGLFECTGTIQSNIIRKNLVYGLIGCSGLIINNLVSGNHDVGFLDCSGEIIGNTIVNNGCPTNEASGLYGTNGIFTNNIIWGNLSKNGSQIHYQGSYPTIRYNCIQNWDGGGEGNIKSDPLFVNSAGDDFHLKSSSPCIDAGCYVYELTDDLDNQVRPRNGVTQTRGNGSEIDMGAYESWGAAATLPTPTQPVNLQPSGGAKIITPRPVLQSSVFSGGLGQMHLASQWQIDTDADCSSPLWDIRTTEQLTSCSTPLGLLSATKAYAWRVRHQNHLGGWSQWSAITTFTITQCDPPAQPVNLAPENGKTLSSITPLLKASAFSSPLGASGLKAAQWQISSGASFTQDVLALDSGAVAGKSEYLAIAYHPQPNHTYYWRVRYQDLAEKWSSWSTPTTFITPNIASLLRVPEQSASIQTAIDYAPDEGMEIVISPGHYRESLLIGYKGLTLRSTNPLDPGIVNATVVDGNSADYTMQVISREKLCRIAGLTVTGSKRCAIYVCDGSLPDYNRCDVEYNHITGNFTSVLLGGTGRVHHNRIENNGNNANLNDYIITECNGIVENNIITNNITHNVVCKVEMLRNNLIAYNVPGTYYLDSFSVLSGVKSAVNNTIVFNGVTTGIRSLYLFDGGAGTICNNIIWGNGPTNGAQVYISRVTPSYCCIQGWQPDALGNFGSDPRLVNPTVGDFRLRADSPCIDAGGFTAEVKTDLQDTLRPRTGVAETRGDGSDFDIGAFEFGGPPAVNHPPNKPVNVEPASGQTVSSYIPTLVSSSFSDPDPGNILLASQWQISRNQAFSSLVSDTSPTLSAVIRWEPAFGLLKPGEIYWWRVRHQDQSTSWSAWSNPTSFKYPGLNAPPTPVNLTPANGSRIETLTPKLVSSAYGGLPPEWKGAAQWQVSFTSSFATPRFDSGPTSAPLFNFTLPRGVLHLEATYWWRVRHRNALGVWSAWSTPTTFILGDTAAEEGWKNFFPTRSGQSCFIHQDKLWIVGPEDAWSSSDGRSWKFRAELPVPVQAGAGALSIGMRFVTFGPSGKAYSSTGGTEWLGTDLRQAPIQRRLNLLLTFKNRLWMIGGQHDFASYTDPSRLLNDVWSSADGLTWTTATLNAGFPARLGHAGAVFQNRLWVIGGASSIYNGDYEGSFFGDVWSSGDGAQWRNDLVAAPFGKRAGHACAVFNNRLWIIGGRRDKKSLSDIWSSADGVNWRQELEAAPFGPRDGHSAIAFNGRLWVIAGSTDRIFLGQVRFNKNDIWSSADGVHWSKETGFTSIQDAIDQAAPGTAVIIQPGRYQEQIYINKNISLCSKNPNDPTTVAATIIAKSSIMFSGKEDATCRLAGFTITNMPGSISGASSKAVIERNVFRNNGTYTTEFYGYQYSPPKVPCGGAIAGFDGLVQYNLFIGNHAPQGGAISECGGTIQNNYFIDNKVYDYFTNITYSNRMGDHTYRNSASGSGSAIDNCWGTIRYNTIVSNDYHTAVDDSGGTITSNIIWNPCPDSPSMVFPNSQTSYWMFYNCIRGWPVAIQTINIKDQYRNINLDPRFVDPDHGDYHLQADSPCIDAGWGFKDLTVDYDGDHRGLVGTQELRGDGSYYDIGADEYVPQGVAVWLAGNVGELRAGQVLDVNWGLSKNAGTAIRLHLYNHGSFIADLGVFWSPTRTGIARVHLPVVLSPGDGWTIRGMSNYAPSLWSQTPPLKVAKASDYNGSRYWMLYD